MPVGTRLSLDFLWSKAIHVSHVSKEGGVEGEEEETYASGGGEGREGNSKK